MVYNPFIVLWKHLLHITHIRTKIHTRAHAYMHILGVYYRFQICVSLRSIQPMDYVGNTYFKVKGEIIQCEKYLLKALGVCVHVQHPHKLIITFLQVLGLEKEVDLVQSVWNYMNDSLRTNVFVRFSPDKIACACIYLAARKFQIALPANPGWWLMFGASKQDIEIISLEILQLYTYPNRSLEELEKEVSKLKEELAKKKEVDIKEIQLSTTQSSRNGSPSKDSPSVVVSGDDKKSSQSGGELKSPSHLNNKLLERNGDRMDLSPSKKTKKRLRSSSLDPSSRHKKKRRSHSPASGASHSSSLENSGGHSDSQFRPISSPIKLSGDSDGSGSLLDDDKRIPRKYQNKYDNHKHKKHRRSRHDRHHKREKHRQRERSRSRTRYESRLSHNVYRNDSVKRHHSSHRRK